jgi:myosin regulatory light chain 12
LSSRPGGAVPANPGEGINFTQFLAMMGERLLHLDAEHDLLEAFACFDDGDKGWVDIKEVRRHLAEMGDHMKEDEVRGGDC